MIGRVVSTKQKKTAAVLVESQKIHRLYKKSFLRSKKFLADDLIGVSEGDIVEIVSVRPISKRKHWRVVKVVGKDIVALGEKQITKVTETAIEEVLPEEAAVETADVETVEKTTQPVKKSKQAPAKKASKKGPGNGTA